MCCVKITYFFTSSAVLQTSNALLTELFVTCRDIIKDISFSIDILYCAQNNL